MRDYYGVTGAGWEQCIPGCVPAPIGEIPRARAAGDGRVRLGGIGMLVEWKRWHLILEALAALPAEVRAKVQFSHIGGADASAESQRYAEKLRALTATRGLTEVVTWRGDQPGAQNFLGTIDCLVVASHQEPFSVAMIEALAADVPVVAADSGGARDIIAPPRNGWLFRSGDARDLARTLGALAEPGALARTTVDRATVRRLSAPVVAEQWVQVYGRLPVDNQTQISRSADSTAA
jgi:glycosyltransferase involved in cell wall biosynthesis